MTRIGVIINPEAGRGNNKGMALANRLSSNKAISINMLRNFKELESVLTNFAKLGVSEIYVSSGDGTVQAIQTLIVEKDIFDNLPRLCLLPHGTTNMTASDLGFRHKSIEAQASFIAGHTREDLRSRPTLRVLNPKDGYVRHGMFLGAGAIADATIYCQRVLNDHGIKGNWATFSMLASAAIKTALYRPNLADPSRFDRPYSITVSKGDGQVCSGQHLMVLCTTLERLILRSHPFWGVKTGPISVSVFPYPVQNVFRWLLPILYGGERRRGPPGAKSFSTDRFEIAATSLFVLDGEPFEGPENGALRIEAGSVFTYICG